MTPESKQISVVVSKDGPYIVSGDAPLSEEIIGGNALRLVAGEQMRRRTTARPYSGRRSRRDLIAVGLPPGA